MKKIKLTQGKYAMVDDSDYEALRKHRWYFCCGYAARNALCSDGKRKNVYMHRVIAKTPKGMETDHINRDTLDNRSVNLRVCTSSQNKMNTAKHAHNTSGYKGVHFHKKNKVWVVQLRKTEKHRNLGGFEPTKKAAIAYNEAAKEHFGEFANLNTV